MTWQSEEQKKAEENYWNTAERALIFGFDFEFEPSKPDESNRVFAKVLIDGEDTLVYMDKETNKAYEIGEGYKDTGKEIKDFTFVRWGRPMDV